MTIVIIIGAILLLVLLWAILIYNGLVARRNDCKNAWAGIETQLQRRHDLIPNLIETVKGYAAHESQTLQNVVQARQSAISAQNSGDPAAAGAAEGMLTGALRQVFALGEAYPDLKASSNFVELQQQLADTEDKLSAARRIYNSNVDAYNTKIEQIPSNIIAGMGNFRQREFFEVTDEGTRAVPAVQFT